MRLARGLTQEELVKRMGGIITKQALSKYETEKSNPSASVAISLAKALNVKTIDLLTPPSYKIEFLAYRKGNKLSASKQKQIEGMLAEEIIHRLELQERLGVKEEFALKPQKVNSLEDAEQVAEYVRDAWNLGSDPIGNLTNALERHSIHVLPVNNATSEFHGISAFAYDDSENICGAGVAYEDGVVGDRQRFTLAHEVGHLVMQVSDNVDEEKAANRFAGSLLIPSNSLFSTLGRSRTHLEINELMLLKKHFGASMQAIACRAKELEIVSESLLKEFFEAFNQLGWRKLEPEPLPSEEPTLWKQLVTRALAERQITHEEAHKWGVEIDKETEDFSNAKVFIRLPKDVRDQLLEKQANEMVDMYKSGGEFTEWVEDYVDDLAGL